MSADGTSENALTKKGWILHLKLDLLGQVEGEAKMVRQSFSVTNRFGGHSKSNCLGSLVPK